MTNEQRVRAFWRRVWVEGDLAHAHDFFAPTYLRKRRRADAGPAGRGVVSPAGTRVEFSGLDVFRFEDGLVVEHLHEADHEALWEQLGVQLPPG